MSSPKDQRLGQFRLRQLLGLTAAVAVVFAVVAPQFRRLDETAERTAIIRSVVFICVTLSVMGGLLAGRHRVEKKAGPTIERFERRSSWIWSWLIAGALWLGFVASVWLMYAAPPRKHENFFDPFNTPMMLYWAVNYTVVRLVWRVDPRGIEACQHGLICGGFQCNRWQDISRYTWSGPLDAQLNLYLRAQMVMNLNVDPAFVNRLDAILAEHVGNEVDAKRSC